MNIIEEIIYPVLIDFQRNEGINFELSENLELYGDNSIFDSLSLMRFIVDIQDKIYEKTDKDIIIVSSDIMTKQNNHFKTVKILAEHIQRLLNND